MSKSGWEDPGSLLPSPTVNKYSIIGGSCWSRTPFQLSRIPPVDLHRIHQPPSCTLAGSHIPTADPKQQTHSGEVRTEPESPAAACKAGMRSIENETLSPVFAFSSQR